MVSDTVIPSCQLHIHITAVQIILLNQLLKEAFEFLPCILQIEINDIRSLKQTVEMPL